MEGDTYKILPRTYNIAKELNLRIEPSKNKNKKIDVYNKDGSYIASIGDKNYSDYNYYIQSHGIEYANQRKKLYMIRHNRDINHLRGYLAMRLLWS